MVRFSIPGVDAFGTPAPREIHVRADPVQASQDQGIARAVLEHGTRVLLQGPGPAEAIVVDVALTHPTLDDMLAATFIGELLEGKRLPEGCKAFADYAATMRTGLRPADLTPENSLEGV